MEDVCVRLLIVGHTLANRFCFQEEGQAAEEVDDGFEDVFGHGFEDLIDDDDDGETGEKVERELHAKVRFDLLWAIDVVVYLFICLHGFECGCIFVCGMWRVR